MTESVTKAGRSTVFREVMEGVLRVAGEDTERPMRLELVATLPEVLRPWGTWKAS